MKLNSGSSLHSRNGVGIHLPALHILGPSTNSCSRAALTTSALKDGRATKSKRIQQILDLDLEDGWSVAPTTSPASSSAKAPEPTTANAAGTEKKRVVGRKAVLAAKGNAAQSKSPSTANAGTKHPSKAAPSAPASVSKSNQGDGKKKRDAAPRAPFMDIQSEQGIMGMALLQARLERGEAAPLTADEVSNLRNKLDEVREAKGQGGDGGKRVKKGTKALLESIELARKAQQVKKRVVYVDDDENIIGEEDEDEDITDAPDAPAFTLTIGEDSTEFAEYDKQGNLIKRTTADFADAPQLDESQQGLDDDFDDDDDDLDFGSDSSGWGVIATTSSKRAGKGSGLQFDDDDDGRGGVSEATKLSARQVEELLGEQGATSGTSLMGGRDGQDETAEWGLEELQTNGKQTLMEQLGVVKKKRSKRDMREEMASLEGTLAADGASIEWGGSGLDGIPAGADLAEQEALLSRMFKPHKVKELLDHQKAAYKATLDLKKGNSTRGKFGNEAKLHKQLRIIAGSAANKRLISSQGAQTRPMMEKVRAAIFNMILSQAGTPDRLPPNARWLDIFAGTGSVGLEALSRGATQCHFVEFDPWVTRNILGENIKSCGYDRKSVVHTSKAEEFLRKARDLPRFAGGAFDFISMCPPYLLVSYPELFGLLEGSPLIHDQTILFVEYPKQLSQQVPNMVGPLVKVRDRKYGRTWIAVYAPPGSRNLTMPRRGEEEDEDEEAGLKELEINF